MKVIGIEEARKTLGDVANEIFYGVHEDPVVLTRNGTPVVHMVKPSNDDPRIHLNVPTQRLAQMVLDGDDDEHRARAELFHRRPHLEGFFNAAQWLQRKHVDAWWEERGGFDPWYCDLNAGPDEAPGYAAIMEAYLSSVRRMAQDA